MAKRFKKIYDNQIILNAENFRGKKIFGENYIKFFATPWFIIWNYSDGDVGENKKWEFYENNKLQYKF